MVRENLAGSGTRWHFQLALDSGPRVGMVGPSPRGTAVESGPPSGLCGVLGEKITLTSPVTAAHLPQGLNTCWAGGQTVAKMQVLPSGSVAQRGQASLQSSCPFGRWPLMLGHSPFITLFISTWLSLSRIS